jgi:hypothetical protein
MPDLRETLQGRITAGSANKGMTAEFKLNSQTEKRYTM